MKTVEIIVKFFLTIVLITGGYLTSYSQIEKVRLETYYISNEDDATDTIGGSLESGNTTYRLFIDLQPGSKLLAIYGDEDHPLRFSSTTPFFNHREEGITFGKDVNRNRYEIGTVALDTYITLGQCSKPFSQGAYFGIPKEGDQDGSVIGGVNNDGGSQEIAAGLLTNANPQMGIPITMADGLTFKKELPDSWIEIGFKDLLTDLDTTIFSLNKTSFSSSNALLRNSGVTGVDPDQNEVLIAQLTTKGDISFEINLEIEILKNGNYQTVKYVAQNSSLKEDEIFEPLLNYPYTCGCTDPHYLEASTLFACSDSNLCKTPIVFGCMDSLACNYDPNANFDIPDLCCYVGYCHDLDLSVICPNLRTREDIDPEQIRLYPNPVSSDLYLGFDFVFYGNIRYTVFNMFGKKVQEGVITGTDTPINTSALALGYYAIRLEIGDQLFTLPFVKM